MKLMKHILVVVSLLAMVLPCVHAAAHDSHHHEEGLALCEIAVAPCACHSCEQQPCTDKVEIQLDRTPVTTTIGQPSIPALLFVLPDTKPVLRKTSPSVSGVLATLRTVQLLI